MMQAAKNRSRHDPQVIRKLMAVHMQWHWQRWRWLWDAGPQGHVRAPSIVMRYPLHEDVSQVVRRQGNQVIQAFPPQCAQQPLAERVRLWTLGWSFQDPEPEVLYAAVKLRREDAIAIMEEEAIAMVRWERFAQLLQCPGGCGMCGHIDMQYPACRVFHEHKHVEEAKGRRHHDTEITGHDRLGMIAHKGSPALRRRAFPSTRVQTLGQILPYGAW